MANDNSKKNAMIELIEKGEDAIHESENALARVWRIMLNSYGYKGGEWQRAITRYQDKIQKITSKKGAANIKGNMTRRLANPKLSWGQLLKGCAVFEIERIEITFKLFKKRDVREFTIFINNDEFISDEDDDEGE